MSSEYHPKNDPLHRWIGRKVAVHAPAGSGWIGTLEDIGEDWFLVNNDPSVNVSVYYSADSRKAEKALYYKGSGVSVQLLGDAPGEGVS